MVNSDLLPFPADESSNASPRWIVMDGRDVRTHLANGVVPGPVDTRPFAAELNPPEKGWRLIDPFNYSTPIPVRSAKHVCLVRLDHPSVRECEEFLTEEKIPASLIEAIAFQTEQAGNDWSVRTRSFPGLPHTLPQIETVDGNIEFCDAEIEDHDTLEQREVSQDESDRIAGAFTTMLVSLTADPDTMSKFDNIDIPDRAFLVDFLADVAGQEPETIRCAMEILSGPDWAEGFDPTELLEALRLGLTPHLDPEQVDAWATYVGAVLNNTREALTDSLLDDRNILLRSLQLLLRSTPLSVAEIEKQIKIRATDVGDRVGQLSLVLAAWYEGFGALYGPAKERPDIYSIGCRTVVGSNRYPLVFSIQEEQGPDLEFVTTLNEGDQLVCCHILRPDPELLRAYRIVESACSENNWELTYDREHELMRLSVDSQDIEAELTPDRELTWRTTMEAGKRPEPRAQVWNEIFLRELLRVAYKFRCTCSSSPQGYPFLGFHSYQRLESLNDASISYHIQAISDAMELVKGLPADPGGKRQS